MILRCENVNQSEVQNVNLMPNMTTLTTQKPTKAYICFHTVGGGEDIMDLDAIIAQLGQLELQLSNRESEIQVASAASRIAEKSNQLDCELHSVLQELSNLESGEEYGGTSSPSYCPSDQFLPRPPVSPGLPVDYNSYLTFDEDVVPSMHLSESKNSFGTISSQSSHSSSTSTGSAKSPQVRS